MAHIGYIYLHRKLLDNFLWESNEKFDKRAAWIDMLLTANHADKEVMFDSAVIVIHRGQFLTSQRKLAQRWGWNHKTVKKYLDTLKQAGMIQFDTTERSTLITILQYAIYQDYKAFKGAVYGTVNGVLEAQSVVQSGSTERSQTINDNKCNKQQINENKIIPAPPCEGGEWQ